MAGTGTSESRAQAAANGEGRVQAIVTRTGFAACILASVLYAAHAQQVDVDAVDSGPVGLAGMLSGLLLFALVAIYNHHRRARDFTAKIAQLEAAIEARDDRIWSLEEQLARVSGLVDIQGDLVLREDEHGRVTHASAAVCALLNMRPDQLAGRGLPFDVRYESERTTLPDGSTSFDQEIAVGEGRRFIAWKVAPVRDAEGHTVETQWVGRDVTLRVAAERALADAREKAEAASRAKSRFLAVVSHEVRTPLNGILGMADLLLDTSLTPEQKTYARAVKSSGTALLGLIEEVLDFSKIEAGRLDLESVPFDLRELVTDVVELSAPRAQSKGIEIAADIDDHIPHRVAGDAARLRQVLLNLAGNAVKFTDEGGVSVIVERAKDGRIRFEVSDTGPGIEPEVRQRIFHEFEQGDATMARRHGGTGLGLAIAGRIVERMGGMIALDNTERGSRFSFVIELPEVSGDGASAPRPEVAGAHILVASPSPVVGPLIVRRLSAWGANVSLASDVTLTKTLLPERDWTHAIIDRAFGPETVRSLVSQASRFASHRLVLLSPADRGELDNLKAAGFDGYLVKPVRSTSLAVRLAAPGAAPPLVPEFEEEPQEGRPLRHRSQMVLVAEDNEINALLIQAMLGKLGHTTTVVGNGIAAVAAVSTAQAMGAPYDLVLMDLHLPGMDGLEATRRIRALGGDAGKIPIIALTANAFAEDRAAAREAGMDGFVVKPMDRERLEEAIETAYVARGAEPIALAQ
ncbi:MAG: response regulator [Bradyrhizobiaceae bacterium]|nr:response regulator [Bradyrhizobiaceae bacterium]